ncbi:MAG: cyclic pyranopterin monophosphate synthase MoaC [Myxococcota bacterium]|nr:cyclic pyranopterin monophosphate synthase MoaC [Myxococcota bacterium]
MTRLTHLDDEGQAMMVDVGEKPLTDRRATAEGWIYVQDATLDAIADGTTPKSDVLATARIAGISAAKRTADLVPLCHPIPLDLVEVDICPEKGRGLRVVTTARAHWRTGVEMEAITATMATLLTLYDMVKAIDRAAEIGAIRLLAKQGGKSGTWTRD